MKSLVIGSIFFLLFSFFALSMPTVEPATAYATLTVGTYASITLSSGFLSNITFPITAPNTLATATGNGNGSSYPSYYVTFSGNVQGNITYSATNFTSGGSYNIPNSNFAMNTTKNNYPSANNELNETFASNRTYAFTNNADKLYTNFWVFAPSGAGSGTVDLVSTMTISVIEA